MDAPAPATAETPPLLVLYDGECGLCSRSVQWLLRHDRRRVLTFAPLQGETARPYVGGATEFETMILVERRAEGGEKIHERSRAILTMLRHIGGFWRVVSWLRYLPAFLTDLPYRFVARRRIAWFGTADACALPDPETRRRFLP